MNPRGLIGAVISSLVLCGTTPAAEPLKVDSLMSSLLKVQDRIAEGDVAALPLQQHLMKLLDAAIAEAGGVGEMSTSEFRALVVFGIIGTGSRAVVDVLSEVKNSKTNKKLAEAIIDYRNRKQKRAIINFSRIEDSKIDDRIFPFVSFARGNLQMRSNPTEAIKHYNLTRLSAPGTLLEEVSLRRLMTLHKAQRQGAEFTTIAKQYARRFLKSPYRKKYVSMLQSGILSMRRTIPLKDIGDIGRLMPIEFAAAFHLRLIRGGLASGHMKLANFSIAQIIGLANDSDQIQLDEPQLTLFKVLSRITSEEPQSLLAELEIIDKTRLKADDNNLLNGAQRVLKSIIAPIDETKTGTPNVDEDSAQSPIATTKKELGMSSGASSGPSNSVRMDDEKKIDDIQSFIDSTKKQLIAIDGVLEN